MLKVKAVPPNSPPTVRGLNAAAVDADKVNKPYPVCSNLVELK
jgi:hypothetical protein